MKKAMERLDTEEKVIEKMFEYKRKIENSEERLIIIQAHTGSILGNTQAGINELNK